ncbi:probable glutathione peroxidase 8 isoform X1 [Takifugu rubripes]|uniref:Glutathione peroxidase n=2 Tax=Takifugu TaxID=31032 RepID=A0A674PBN6_TAKRU|nr:probable glutathione peroxidase 8 isoform X1 [Takifugu rubripes]XP_056888301.1 probable glutathione peroxidase 8 isoform X2 [Takifugu flavidus]TWW60302.1 putative glutathione peroxidase 8 [Takifugu flavidus]
MEALGGYPTRSSNPKAKKLTVLLSMTVGVGCLFLLQTQLLKPRRPSDFYSFEVKDAKGRTVSLEKYRGKASLVVNVASYSEQTEGNYRYLQELHRELGTSHFNVLAFPCGQFGDTEPGTSRDSEAFAKATYGVTFPFFNRIKIMGSEAEPAFRFLTDSVHKVPKWNFWKFLVNPEGKVVRFWRTDEPLESIRQEVTTLVREIIVKKRVEL